MQRSNDVDYFNGLRILENSNSDHGVNDFHELNTPNDFDTFSDLRGCDVSKVCTVFSFSKDLNVFNDFNDFNNFHAVTDFKTLHTYIFISAFRKKYRI